MLDRSCYTARMSKHPKRPRDTNQLAKSIVDLTTGDTEEEKADEGKDPAAVALGRKGGLKGGKARAEKLTPKQRSEIAKKAATARWAKTKQQSEALVSEPVAGKKKHIIQLDRDE